MPTPKVKEKSRKKVGQSPNLSPTYYANSSLIRHMADSDELSDISQLPKENKRGNVHEGGLLL